MVAGLKGVCLNGRLSKEAILVKEQLERNTLSSLNKPFCIISASKVCFSHMSLRLKTQKRVLVWIAGASEKIVSKLSEQLENNSSFVP